MLQCTCTERRHIPEVERVDVMQTYPRAGHVLNVKLVLNSRII